MRIGKEQVGKGGYEKRAGKERRRCPIEEKGEEGEEQRRRRREEVVVKC